MHRCHARQAVLALLGRLNLFHRAGLRDMIRFKPTFHLRKAILWSDRVSVRVAVAVKLGGYGFALHIKQCSTERGPTKTSDSTEGEIAEKQF